MLLLIFVNHLALFLKIFPKTFAQPPNELHRDNNTPPFFKPVFFSSRYFQLEDLLAPLLFYLWFHLTFLIIIKRIKFELFQLICDSFGSRGLQTFFTELHLRNTSWRYFVTPRNTAAQSSKRRSRHFHLIQANLFNLFDANSLLIIVNMHNLFNILFGLGSLKWPPFTVFEI